MLYEEYQEHSVHSFNNRKELEASNRAACCFCYSVFSTKDIKKYIESDDTGVCPNCGIDVIIGDASGLPISNFDFMKEMHFYGFDYRMPSYSITIKEIKSLGGPCPWHWTGMTDDNKYVFIRERWNVLRIEIDDELYLQTKVSDSFSFEELVDVCKDYVTFLQTPSG